MASAQAVETSVNTNNSPSQDYTTNPDDHSNHNTTQYNIITFFLFLLNILANNAVKPGFVHFFQVLNSTTVSTRFKDFQELLGCSQLHLFPALRSQYGRVL